ncbi:hypothetical protein [Spirosoma pulveris]
MQEQLVYAPESKILDFFQLEELEERLENKWYVVNNGPQEDNLMEVTVVVVN